MELKKITCVAIALRFHIAFVLLWGSCFASVGEASFSPQFRISTRRSTDQVEVKVAKEATLISIRSPTGISSATIERSDEAWPKVVLLRLYVRGLESFQMSQGNVSLHASVSSQDGRVRIWKDGQEGQSLDAKNPLWMEIQMMGRDGKQTQLAPLVDGYFQIRLPSAFFEKNPKTITVEWIDFYRN